MNTDFVLTVSKDLTNLLNNPKAINKAKNIVKKSAGDLQKLAKEIVPKDTGDLERSIKIYTYNNGLSAEVYADMEYAAYVELGTRKMAAQPYMRPAFNTVKPIFEERIRKAFHEK